MKYAFDSKHRWCFAPQLNEDQAAEQKPFQCLCGIAMVYCKKHQRRLNDEIFNISAQFKISPGKRHLPSCVAHPEIALQLIAEHSDPAVLSGGDGATLDWLPVTNDLWNTQASETATEDQDTEELDSTVETLVKRKGQLPSYLATAKHVVRLVREARKSDIPIKINLKYRKETLSWSDIFYERNDYQDLALKCTSGSGKGNYSPYPVAINGNFKMFETRKNPKTEQTTELMKFSALKEKNHYYIPTFLIPDVLRERLRRRLEKGDELIVIGNASVNSSERDGCTYTWINFSVKSSRQVALV